MFSQCDCNFSMHFIPSFENSAINLLLCTQCLHAKKSIRNILHANIYVHSRRLIAEFSRDGIKCIEKLQSHFENMTFYDKSRYDSTFQKVTHKGGEYAINYIKSFQNAHALLVSVGNSYSEYQLMHIFLDNFCQGGKYSSQIANHQAKSIREE